MRQLLFPLGASLIAAALVVAGCITSPVGINTSDQALPTPADDKVTLTYVPPADKTPAKVTFQVVLPDEAASAPSAFDDSPDDGFTVELPTAKLNPGLYDVAIFFDEDEQASGHLLFAKPDPAKLEEGEATPEATASGS